MASLKKRNGKYCVIYRYRDKEGKKKQKWETFDSRAEAIKRMKEIEYKKSNGTFVVPQCKLMSELLKEYVDLYGKEKWALSTYDSNLSLISNYIEPVIGKVDLGKLICLISTHDSWKPITKLSCVHQPALQRKLRKKSRKLSAQVRSGISTNFSKAALSRLSSGSL